MAELLCLFWKRSLAFPWLFSSSPPALYFWCFTCWVYEADQTEQFRSLLVLNHLLEDAGVATPRRGQRQCWWDLGERSCGRRCHVHAQHLTELPPKASSSGGRPCAWGGGGGPESPLWDPGRKGGPLRVSSLRLSVGPGPICRQPVDGIAGERGPSGVCGHPVGGHLGKRHPSSGTSLPGTHA